LEYVWRVCTEAWSDPMGNEGRRLVDAVNKQSRTRITNRYGRFMLMPAGQVCN
jgi:hypothetical protein